MTDFLKVFAPYFLSIGLTIWVYRTLNSVIKSLRDEITQMTNDIETLKQDLAFEREQKNKWYKKYFVLLGLIKKHGQCKPDCPAMRELNDYLSKEGEIL